MRLPISLRETLLELLHNGESVTLETQDADEFEVGSCDNWNVKEKGFMSELTGKTVYETPEELVNAIEQGTQIRFICINS